MKCNWTENDKKVSYNEYAIPYYKIIECESTNTTRDKDNVNERYFCEIHLKQVKEIRKLMHKNCINKEKLINFIITTLKENKESNSSNLFKIGKESVLFNLQIYINEGDFD